MTVSDPVPIAQALPPKRSLARLPEPPFGPIVHGLDALRGRALTLVGPLARSVVLPRERRVALVATALLLVALAVTCTMPILLLALGPLIWGVPHLVSDVRYLVARPSLHRQRALWAAALVGLPLAALGLGVRAGIAATAAAILFGRAPIHRKLAGAIACGALFALAAAVSYLADVAFLQLHNVIALGLWLAWRRRQTRLHWIPIAVFVAASSFLFLGPAGDWLSLSGRRAWWSDLGMQELADSVSPTSDPELALRFVLFFAFAQTAHYVVWLHLVPHDDRARSAPVSFAQSYRSLLADVGPLTLWLASAAAAAIAIVALYSVSLARLGYLGVAFFHAHLELVVIGLWCVQGRSVLHAAERAGPA